MTPDLIVGVALMTLPWLAAVAYTAHLGWRAHHGHPAVVIDEPAGCQGEWRDLCVARAWIERDIEDAHVAMWEQEVTG